jgi:hypothetical protein
MCQYVAVLVLVSVTNSWAADQEFYRTFLSIVDTNSLRAVAIKSPLLVDTNNATPKLTNVVVNLSDSKAKGRLGDGRLGMSREEVAACWGKPQFFWSRCFGGPRCGYADVNVIFEPGSNCVRSIFCSGRYLPRCENGLSAASIEADFLRVLGSPSSCSERAEGAIRELIYGTPAATMCLLFVEGNLSSFRLDHGSERAELKK